MVFNQLDPMMFAICLRELLDEKQKQEDPTKLLESLWKGLVQHLIKDVINFFKMVVVQWQKRKTKPKRLKKRRQRPVLANQADFELLAVYASVPTENNSERIGMAKAANQANPNLVHSKSTYAAWRRRHYPLGLVHEPITQMTLPLHHDAKKKSATDLFDAEIKLRNRMNHLETTSKTYISGSYNQIAS